MVQTLHADLEIALPTRPVLRPVPMLPGLVQMVA
jgi:hypothetical protein